MKFKSMKVGKKFTYHCYDKAGLPTVVDAIVVKGEYTCLQSHEQVVDAIGHDNPSDVFSVSEDECEGGSSFSDCWVTPARKSNRMTLTEPATAVQHVWEVRGSGCRVVWDVGEDPLLTELGAFLSGQSDGMGLWEIKQTTVEVRE